MITGSAETVNGLFRSAVDHHKGGRLTEAEDGYRRVLAHQPLHADALHYLGVLVHHKGEHAKAEALLRRAVEQKPEQAIFHNNFGNVLMAMGRAEAATASFRRATELKPDFAQAYGNLSGGLLALGEHRAAETAARVAVRHQPKSARARFNLGNILAAAGKPAEAFDCAEKAIEADPGHALTQALAGSALLALGRADDALSYFERAIALDPRDAMIHANRGNALLDAGRLDDAVFACRHALEINPMLAVTHAVLGNALKQQGRIGEAETAYRNAMAADPGLASAHSNLLFVLHYDPDRGPARILTEARKWNAAFAPPSPPPSPPAPASNGNALDRPLRVGYVSADLRRHSVGYFMESIIRNHDPAAVEVFCFSNAKIDDDRTAEFRAWSPHWAEITALDDGAAADLIRRHRIDILVDLSGHTGGNRLPVFARRPAPVQISYLGYPGTTGLDVMDYRLTDAVADPEGSGERDYTETLVRLPDGFLCYAPPAEAPRPARSPGPITFASFNNVPKINEQVVAVWSRILHSVAGAQLLLKHASFSDPRTCQRFRDMFAERGIDADRLTLTGFVESTGGHLALYNKVDVALDTFPYNGTTTTAEALWMGVPVITYAGDRHAARVGASILTHAGLRHLVAHDPDEYVALAVEIAGKQDELMSYRSGLRDIMAKSRFLDGKGFTRALETTYLDLWQQRKAT